MKIWGKTEAAIQLLRSNYIYIQLLRLIGRNEDIFDKKIALETKVQTTETKEIKVKKDTVRKVKSIDKTSTYVYNRNRKSESLLTN